MKDRMAAACRRFQVRCRTISQAHAVIRRLVAQMEGNVAIEALADEILDFAKVCSCRLLPSVTHSAIL